VDTHPRSAQGRPRFPVGTRAEAEARGWNNPRRTLAPPESRDIDIVTRRNFALWKRSEGLNGVMRSLGAEACGYNAKRRQYRAAFHVRNESQTVEIWSHEPQPRGAERETEVDGGVELVLATSQILKGKLERGEDALPRDLLDVITAARRDPESLEVAVNAAPSGGFDSKHRADLLFF
jgi:hypothetical protein